MDRISEMEAFAAVVDLGGFTGAAAHLGLSKSAVSKSISSLENRLGTKLLSRTTRRVSPTRLGMIYYDKACHILRKVNDAGDLISQFSTPPKGHISILAPVDLGQTLLLPLILEFLTRFAEITISLRAFDGSSHSAPEPPDLSVLTEKPPRGMARKILCQTQLRLVASPQYLSANGEPATIDALNRHSLLHFEPRKEPGFWTLKAPSGEIRRIRAKGRFSAGTLMPLAQAAIMGQGIALLPEYLVTKAMKQGRLKPVLTELPHQFETIFLAWNAKEHVQPKVHHLVTFLSETLSGPSVN